jgi:transcriptional regulator with XRE-family HTH domain
MTDEKLEWQDEPEDFTEIILTDENITQEQINEMKMLGLPKPDGVSWERWSRLQSIRIEHKHMIRLAVSGMSQGQIAQELGYDQAHVSKVLNTPEVKAEIDQQMKEVYGETWKKPLQDRFMKSIKVIDELLENGGEKIRADLAKWSVEQVAGKASQEIKETKTTLNEFIVRVQQMEEQGKLRDVGSSLPQLSNPPDPFDNVIKQVIPDGMTVGKRSSGEGQG